MQHSTEYAWRLLRRSSPSIVDRCLVGSSVVKARRKAAKWQPLARSVCPLLQPSRSIDRERCNPLLCVFGSPPALRASSPSPAGCQPVGAVVAEAGGNAHAAGRRVKAVLGNWPRKCERARASAREGARQTGRRTRGARRGWGTGGRTCAREGRGGGGEAQCALMRRRARSRVGLGKAAAVLRLALGGERARRRARARAACPEVGGRARAPLRCGVYLCPK